MIRDQNCSRVVRPMSRGTPLPRGAGTRVEAAPSAFPSGVCYNINNQRIERLDKPNGHILWSCSSEDLRATCILCPFNFMWGGLTVEKVNHAPFSLSLVSVVGRTCWP